MNRIGVIAVAAVAAVMMAAPALACSPLPFPPPPPVAAGTSEADAEAQSLAWMRAHAAVRAEEDRVWRLKGQAALFDEAKSLIIVRYDREEKTSGAPKEFDYMNGQPMAVLKPVRWVKGNGASDDLKISRGQLPPCGQMIGHDAFYGKPGEVFLVYLNGNKVEQQYMLEALAIDRIIEPRTLAALIAH